MIQKLKNLIKGALYYLVSKAVRPSNEINKDTMLFIRTDAVGDYLLFRNFIEIVRISQRYRNYKITLLGNSVWRELAKDLDSKFVDNFIWIDIRKFERNLFYRYLKLSEITASGYEVVISSAYSRDYFISDNIVKLVCSREKIGSSGDLSNISLEHKEISDQFYTTLIPASAIVMFEFYRNREFFECLLGEKLHIKRPDLRLTNCEFNFEPSGEYVILFVGASSQSRRWSIANFSEVANFLTSRHGYQIVLCGGPTEKFMVLEFSRFYRGDFLDMVGRTSLTELATIIEGAKLIVSNETSAPHLAAAIGGPSSLVIYNGNHFGRFTPYPLEIRNQNEVIYHPLIAKDLDEYAIASNAYGYESKLDIDEIKSVDVIDGLKRMI